MAKTKLEIIEETVAYYSEDTSRRGLDEVGECVFKTVGEKVVKMCAVGRCLDFTNLDPLQINREGGVHFELLLHMKKEYVGHSLDFWKSLQVLHDLNRYWNSKGLTELGNSKLKALKEKWKE